jgi:hypothetical protein
MFDARTFPATLKDAEKILAREKAVFKGDYVITDKIYISTNHEQTLDKVYLRLRLISKNIWSEKPVIVVIKNTELKEVGKKSVIPLKREFDTVASATEFIEKNYAGQFEFSFEFDRNGRQYFLGEDGVDLEDIEGHVSIEFKSTTEKGLRQLISLFNVKESEVIKGPSVVAIRDLLKK